MTEQKSTQAAEQTREGDTGPGKQYEPDNDGGIEAEQDSAAAMDADVPQPPGADETTEGQPS